MGEWLIYLLFGVLLVKYLYQFFSKSSTENEKGFAFLFLFAMAIAGIIAVGIKLATIL